MKHHVINIADKELKCRINTQNSIALESKLGGKSVILALMQDTIPSLEVVLNILHASLQTLEHGYTMKEVYKLFDEFVEEGYTIIDLVPELLKVLEVSGFFKNAQEGEVSS